jgi:hypothetical protein
VEREGGGATLEIGAQACSLIVLLIKPAMPVPDLTLKRAKRLRRPMTPQEIGLWLRVKNRQLGGFDETLTWKPSAFGRCD